MKSQSRSKDVFDGIATRVLFLPTFSEPLTEYAGRGVCPIVASSLDGPKASNAYKRKIENVVYDPETNEIGFYNPKKLFSFDSESQFGV